MSHATSGLGNAIMSGIKISRVIIVGSLKGRDVEDGERTKLRM